MINLLHDIGGAVWRVQSLRAKINELTEELHREEMKIAVESARCLLIRSHDIELEKIAKELKP